MSAISLMFVIYIMVVFFWFLHADNSTLIGTRIWDQSPIRRFGVFSSSAMSGVERWDLSPAGHARRLHPLQLPESKP